MVLNNGIVTTPHPTASEAGRRILTAGGTAVDAAIAAAFALTVVTPSCSGIAGYGGCALIYLAKQRAIHAVEFVSRAPSAASADMFQAEESASGAVSVAHAANAVGPLAVDVPGVLAGLTLIQSRFGTLPLPPVMQPAIDAALSGYPADALTVQSIRETLVPRADDFPETFHLFSIAGRVPRVGEALTNRPLARVLTRISKEGPSVFYRGDVAHAIVETVQRGGGRLTLDDLASYRATEVPAVQSSYRNLTLVTVPLPMAGLTVLQMLRVFEGFDLRAVHNKAALYHHLIEVAKACWRDRLTRYGDPDHIRIDANQELGEAHIRILQDAVVEGIVSPSPGEVISPDPLDSSTVHLCAADRAGNVVTLTHTHGGSFGSLMVVPGTGIVLSHGISRFDPRPGRPNSIAPGKRPLNNMAPLLICKNGRPVFVIGGAGGRTILPNLLHTIVRVMDLGASPDAAIAATRFHVETAEPVHIEEGGDDLAAALRGLGHTVRIRPPFGALQCLIRNAESESMTGTADPRRGGVVAVV